MTGLGGWDGEAEGAAVVREDQFAPVRLGFECVHKAVAARTCLLEEIRALAPWGGRKARLMKLAYNMSLNAAEPEAATTKLDMDIASVMTELRWRQHLVWPAIAEFEPTTFFSPDKEIGFIDHDWVTRLADLKIDALGRVKARYLASAVSEDQIGVLFLDIDKTCVTCALLRHLKPTGTLLQLPDTALKMGATDAGGKTHQACLSEIDDVVPRHLPSGCNFSERIIVLSEQPHPDPRVIDQVHLMFFLFDPRNIFLHCPQYPQGKTTNADDHR